jgi:ribosomal protein S18 acetylase RimI-like enzyme
VSRGFAIRPVRTSAEVAAAARLFRGYSASLDVDLGYQSFDEEVVGLPGRYAPPSGELFLAFDRTDAPIGCAALRGLEGDGRCEMKRLFLLPEARGLGVGRALAEEVVRSARALGYRELLLDTMPSMQAAIGIYEKLGFERIAAYYAPTPACTLYMRLTLRHA